MSRVLVIGGGVSGLAAARLAGRLGYSVTVYDLAPSPELVVSGYGVASGEWDFDLLRGVDRVIVSPGFPERSAPVVETLEYGTPIISEIEFAYQNLDSPVVAVTGTNGKTSVTEAASAMLRASGLDAPAAGNIGAPLSSFTDRTYDALVVEVSSFQLRFIDTFHPLAAGITNVAVDHLDWHGSVFSYREAKARIFENQTADDLLVFDDDDEGARSLAAGAASSVYPVSGRRLPAGGGGVDGGALRVMGVSIPLDRLASADPTLISNLAVAAALSIRVGAAAEGIVTGAAGFTPGRHRRTVVAVGDDVTWIDDSKATNPHAAIASVRNHQSVILIAGGLTKGVDVAPLADEPAVKLLIGIGEAGPKLVERAGDRGVLAGTLDTAVAIAAERALPGDTVLLAPGCASFDQFASYGDRGDRFIELVESTVSERV